MRRTEVWSATATGMTASAGMTTTSSTAGMTAAATGVTRSGKARASGEAQDESNGARSCQDFAGVGHNAFLRNGFHRNSLHVARPTLDVEHGSATSS
jgi:hypothetical protein